MVDIPANVIEKMNAQGTVKALVTADASGQPHAIICGSILSPSPDKVIVGEVLMKRSADNLAKNAKAAIMVSAGPEAYEIVVTNPVRMTEGPIVDQMNEGLAKAHLTAKAVWMFDVCAVYDEGAGPNAGTKIA